MGMQTEVDLVLGYDGNYGDLLTRRFDLGFTKSWDLKFGTVSVNYMGTLMEEQTFSFGSSASSVDCAGKMNLTSEDRIALGVFRHINTGRRSTSYAIT